MSHASHRLSGLGRWRTQIIVVAGVAAAATLGAGVSLAATSSPPSRTVNACENTSTHALYLRTGSKCAKGYVGLSWNIVGPKGATGKTGPQGPAGENGNNGENGTNGVSPTVLELNGTDSNCPYGGDVVTGADEIATYICNGAPGAAGQTGPQGPAGNNGTNGQSPTVTIATAQECPNGGMVITDPTSGTSYPVCNGTDGTDGSDGTSNVLNVQVFSTTQDFGPNGIGGAWCGAPNANTSNEGWVVIGGGADWDTTPGTASTSDYTAYEYPQNASNTPSFDPDNPGWTVVAGPNGGEATVYAVCVQISS